MEDYTGVQVLFISTTQFTFMISDIYARYINDRFGISPVVMSRIFDGFDFSDFDTGGKYTIEPFRFDNSNILGQSMFALKCGYLFNATRWRQLLDTKKRIVLFVHNDRSKLVSRMIECVKEADCRNTVVLVEEGNDTYAASLAIRHEALWKLKHRISRILFGAGRTSRVIGDNPLIDYAIVKDPEKYSALSKAGCQIVIRQTSGLILKAGRFVSNIPFFAGDGLKCDVIFLGQPFYKKGRRYGYEEICISGFIEAVPPSAKILIKPHPRDLEGKYHVFEDKYDNVSVVKEGLDKIPVEALMEMSGAVMAVTIQSSAVLNLADMFPEIRCIVLRKTPEARDLLKKLQEAGEELPRVDDDFFTRGHENVDLVTDMAECKEILKHISSGDVRKKGTDEHETKVTFDEIDTVMESA